MFLHIVLTLLIVGGVAATILYAIQFQRETERAHQEMLRITNTFKPAMAHALWQYDKYQIKLLVEGLHSDQGVSYVKASDTENYSATAGTRPYHTEVTDIPVYYQDVMVGTLSVSKYSGGPWLLALQQSLPYITSIFILLAVLAAALMLVIHRSITYRITHLAQAVQTRIDDEVLSPVDIRPSDANDEIDQLMQSFRTLNERLIDEIHHNTEVSRKLSTVNAQLEDRVEERTRHLSSTIERLNQTVEKLNTTQTQLIEAEKLSALGSMIAGIGHEIETPLGLCLTMESCLRNDVEAVREHCDEHIDNQEWQHVIESLNLLRDNLRRASALMTSFKSVTAGQINDDNDWINLRTVIDDLLRSLSPMLKQLPYNIKVECPGELRIQASPTALNQILTNLITNSLKHGFFERDEGNISIIAAEDTGRLIMHYSDDGIGLNREASRKIFEPMFTTRRGEGGTGIGMHLVYNIVKQKMKGEISIEPSDTGVCFRIEMPLSKAQRRDRGRQAIY